MQFLMEHLQVHNFLFSSRQHVVLGQVSQKHTNPHTCICKGSVHKRHEEKSWVSRSGKQKKPGRSLVLYKTSDSLGCKTHLSTCPDWRGKELSIHISMSVSNWPRAEGVGGM